MLMMNTPGRRPVSNRELARRGHQGAHRLHDELRQEALGGRRARRRRGSQRARPGEAGASGCQWRTDYRRRLPGGEGIPGGLLDRGRRHSGAGVRHRRRGIGGPGPRRQAAEHGD